MAVRTPRAKRPPQRAPTEAPAPLRTYGIKFKAGAEPWPLQNHYDSYAFASRRSIDTGVPPRAQLFRQLADRMAPGFFEWHEWTNHLINALCSYTLIGKKAVSIVCVPGCSNSAKTRNASGFAAIWWLCDPLQSSVTLVSTSKGSLKKRAWNDIQTVYTSEPLNRFGVMTDSMMTWRAIPGDHKHAIFGKAVEEGSITRVADDIKGVHTKRQMIIIDEATAVPEAIFDAANNLYSYGADGEFIMVVMGNPRTRLDLFGRLIEPADGWQSISIDSEEWEGKPQKDYGGIVPQIVRFDAERSPNIVEGHVVSKHLPTKEMVEAQRVAGQTALWWSNFRGFPPPDGLVKTIFSTSAIEQNSGGAKFVFSGQGFYIVGAFDPAFGGGDRPVLRFAKVGMLLTGIWGVEWLKPIVIKLDMTKKHEIHYQLMEQVVAYCEKFHITAGGEVYPGPAKNLGEPEYSCPPDSLGIDASGEGGGLCDIFAREWSPKIHRIEFAGSASKDPVSPEDPRPADEVYWTKSVEMHFRAKFALDHGQLRGIDSETAKELCQREFMDQRNGHSSRIRLQDKKEYRKMYRESPDLGDSGVMCLEVARLKGFRLAPKGLTRNKDVEWEQQVRKSQEVYEDLAWASGVESEEMDTAFV